MIHITRRSSPLASRAFEFLLRVGTLTTLLACRVFVNPLAGATLQLQALPQRPEPTSYRAWQFGLIDRPDLRRDFAYQNCDSRGVPTNIVAHSCKTSLVANGKFDSKDNEEVFGRRMQEDTCVHYNPCG